MKQRKKSEIRLLTRAFLLAICVFLLFLLFYGSSMPYVGYNAWNFNIYSLIAHNYNNFGLIDSKFAPIISVSEVLPKNPSYYLNHPPVLSILIAFVFRIFGETFLTGRAVNIAASFFSCILLYATAKEIVNKRYALIVLLTSSLIPATTVFGKMIGQESLVMFFALLALYAFTRFRSTEKKRLVVIGMVSIFLGTLSDWSMIYFTFMLCFYLFWTGSKKIAVSSMILSVCTGIFYFVYAYVITGNISFLLEGFVNRSGGELLRKKEWGVVWITTIFSRLFLYYNPFLLFLAGFSALKYLKKNRNLLLLTCSLFGFGLIHVLLYPEGSYGHPYWTYYLFPSISLASALMIQKLFLTKKIVAVCLLGISTIYVLFVVQWKVKELQGNVFRYQLAKIASAKIPDYATILINRTGPIDPDIFQYSFHHQTLILGKNERKIPKAKFSTAVFSCVSSCEGQREQLSLFKKDYSATQFKGKGLEMWVFTRSRKLQSKVKVETVTASLPRSSQSVLSKLYQRIIQFSTAPQL